MSTYTHTLTETEIACGVTLDDVARELPRGLMIDNLTAFAVSNECSPALAGSVARAAFGGPVRFVGHNSLGMPIYRAERAA